MQTRRLWVVLGALSLITGCPTDEEETGMNATTDPTTATDSPASSSGIGSGSSGESADGSSGLDTDADTDSTTAVSDTDSSTGTDGTGTGPQGCGMPEELGSTMLNIDGFDVIGTDVYAALRGDGMGVLDASDPAAISVVGMLDVEGEPVYRAASDGSLIVGGRRGGGAIIIDASDPSSLVELWGSEDVDTEDIVLDGTFAYLASPAGLSILDLSTPDTPVVIIEDVQQDGAGMNIGGSTIAKDGDIVYMAGFDFTPINVSDPAMPMTLAEVDTGRPNNLIVSSGYAYVGGNDGVEIFDVTDPATPALVGTYPGERASLIALDDANSRLYVFGSSTASTQVPLLRIVDVADPAAPVEIGSMYDDLDDPLWAKVEGTRLYFTTDATEPATLYVVEGCPPPS